VRKHEAIDAAGSAGQTVALIDAAAGAAVQAELGSAAASATVFEKAEQKMVEALTDIVTGAVQKLNATNEDRRRSCFDRRDVTRAANRSPLSPWPLFTFVFALVRRSARSDLPTSSDSLKRPFAPRLTYRLSAPVLISSRFAAFLRSLPCALASMVLRPRSVQARCRKAVR
jgi:hypothetical protein